MPCKGCGKKLVQRPAKVKAHFMDAKKAEIEQRKKERGTD